MRSDYQKKHAGAWHRKTHTGFIRPKRITKKHTRAMFYKLKKGVQQQMLTHLATSPLGVGITDDDTLVKELP